MGIQQSHLPIKFAKRGIRTIAEVNRFLEKEYQELFNQKFSVKLETESIFVPLAETMDIDTILCVKHIRKTEATGRFSFKNCCFQILDKGFPLINARREIEMLVNPQYGIHVVYGGCVSETTE